MISKMSNLFLEVAVFRLSILGLAYVFLSFHNLILAQENIYLVTYGAEAKAIEGDDDKLQIIFIQVPSSVQDSLYIRIFDADCGGKLDTRYRREWNTEIRYRLFGGKGTFSDPGMRSPSPGRELLQEGMLLADETIGEDPFKDSQWYNFTHVSPTDGETVGSNRYFKLVVEGISGNDGNVFDISISGHPRRNITPEGVELFSYSPTIRLPNRDVFAELRYWVPAGVSEITVHNFDVSKGIIGVETAFRSNIPAKASGQNEWAESTVELYPKEVGRLCALRFEGGREMPNDAAFYVTLKTDEVLPIQLPVFQQEPNRRPVPHFELEPLAECNSVMFDASRTYDPDGDEMEFLWDFGDGSTGQGSRIVHHYDDAGDYMASLIVVDGSGHISNSIEEKINVKVNHPPISEAGPDLVGMPGEKLKFNGSESTDLDGNILKYFWSFGDGKKQSGRAISYSYEQPGFYTATLRVQDDSPSPCNSDVDQLEVWINAPPVVEIGNDIIASVGQTLHFSASHSHDSDGEIISYEWELGDGAKKPGINITHAYELPGIFRVVLVIKDNANAKNSYARDNLKVFVNDPPVANAGKDHRVAANEEITFDGSQSLDRDGKIVHYSWDFGDGSKTEGKKVKHAYVNPGQYWAILNVKDNSTSTSDTDIDSALVIINHPPVANAGPDQLVTASEVQFNAEDSYDTDGEIIEFQWDFGDGVTGTGDSPKHVYNNPGTYTVMLTVTDDSKTSSRRSIDETEIIVNYAPIADAGPDLVSSPDVELTFDGSSSFDLDGHISEFHWDFGDGHTSEDQISNHTFTRPGKYTVTLTVRDNSGHENAVDYDQTRVWINQPPVANAGMDVQAAPDQMITFDAKNSVDLDGNIASYRWDFSDGKGTTRERKTTRSFSEPGTYTATLTVADNSGASNSISQDRVLIKVNSRPESKPGKDLFTCSRIIQFDGSASTDADGDKLHYTWDFGDDTPPGSGAKVLHTYSNSGTYPVSLTVDDGTGLANSLSTSSITVKINEAPIAIAGEDRTVCAGDVVIFDGGNSIDPEGGLLKYRWDFGDGTITEGVNPTKVYAKGGVYLVTLTVTDDSGLPNCNTSTDQIVVRVAESPVADAGPDKTVCANVPVTFDGTQSIDIDGLVNSYLWDFGDGTSGGGGSPIHVYTQSGVFRVTLTITGDRIGNCDNTDTDEMIVTVYEAPAAEFTCTPREAQGVPVHFDASNSAVGGANIIQWEWDFGDNTYGEGEKIDHAYNKSGTYIVTLKIRTDTETDCAESSIQGLVNINEPPTAVAGDNQLVGTNQVVTFDGSGSSDQGGAISEYFWDFGDGDTASGVEVKHEYDAAGMYEVILRVTDDSNLGNNTDTDTLIVEVNDTPVPKIKSIDLASINETIVFDGSGSYDSNSEISKYIWDFGDNSTAEGQIVEHSYSRFGTYTVTLEVNDGSQVSNSRAQVTKTVKINGPPKAHAAANPLISPKEETVFNGSGSLDHDGFISEYHWEFGDGVSAKGQQVRHQFASPGLYKVILVVTDDSNTANNRGEDSIYVRVNAPPVAVVEGDTFAFFGGAHDKLRFDASGSHDPDEDPLTFKWEFGDGSSAQGKKVVHGYDEPGTYSVELIVDDGTGTKSATNSASLTVTIMRREDE